MSKAPITVNGRIFNWPKRTLVVICLDGSEPSYTDEARKRGLMPNLEKLIAKGGEYRADSVIPSFTNPNNLSIVAGRAPEVHGICGNYLIDPDTGLETMMNDPKWLRAPTIFAEFQKAGARILIDSARGSVTGENWHDLTEAQLDRWGVKYHRVRTGVKFFGDRYIDDKAISDEEFFR